jgi:hypothetical protein
MPDKGKNEELFEKILKDLEEIRDKLIYVNTLNGNLERYRSMKREIQENGWDGICRKYHPDFNTSDPAAYELFRFYKYVYDTMDSD